MSTPHGGARPSSSPASEQRRQRIADATLALLRERDAAKITVADIAETADVSVATVYNLVGPRERVLSAVLDGYVGRLDAALGARPMHNDPVEAVVDVVRVAVTQSLHDPVPLRAVLRELGPLDFAENRGSGLEQLLLPRLRNVVSLDDDSAARTVAQLIVYGFRGVLLSWAHLLISDTAFHRDAELITRSLVPDDREIEETL